MPTNFAAAKSPPRVAINGSLAVAKANSTVYSQARHLLHTQLTDVIIGRDNEIAALKGFIEPALKNKTALSLYISGWCT